MNQDRVFVSKIFIRAIKENEKPIFKIAVHCNINPSSLSRIINCIEVVKKDDPRILRLAEYLGLKPDDCFEERFCSARG